MSRSVNQSLALSVSTLMSTKLIENNQLLHTLPHTDRRFLEILQDISKKSLLAYDLTMIEARKTPGRS